MRYKSTHKATVRTRLIQAAGALVKSDGFAASGVDGIARAAGLSGGGFYTHFSSKDELLRAVIENELQAAFNLLLPDYSQENGEKNLQRIIRRYLSAQHLASPAEGCMLPTLLPEISRSDLKTREIFQQGLEEWIKRLQQPGITVASLYSILALLAGSITLARTLTSEVLQVQLLEESVRMAQGYLASMMTVPAQPGPLH